MDSSIRILRRFIGASIIISIFLLILNFIMLGTWFFKGMYEGQSPQVVVQDVAEGLLNNSGKYSLTSKAQEHLDQLHAWSMLLDHNGHVIWSYDLPAEMPLLYSLADVAQFSRYYLMDYPVFVWTHDIGIVVVGYPKDSLAKYQFNFPIGWVSSLPFRSVSLLVGNIALALLLSLLIGSRQIKSIKPLITGILALGKEQPVNIETKGFLGDLAKSINYTSILLQEKNNSLKARDEARSNWIAGISHDIRTPLSMVLGYASELEENEAVPMNHRKQAAIIRQQGEKLRSLVSDLNLVSMLEYEMQPLNIKPIRLSSLVRQAASEFLNNGLLDERFNLELDIFDESLRVNGDEKLLLRAINNLLQNCIVHNPKGCQILLKTSLDSDGKTCRFAVSDNGKGLPQSELSNLLELPYSSKRKHHDHNGHGLGLPMVARIAKAHHGQLILTSDSGKGMEAEILLPGYRTASFYCHNSLFVNNNV